MNLSKHYIFNISHNQPHYIIQYLDFINVTQFRFNYFDSLNICNNIFLRPPEALILFIFFFIVIF